MLEYWSNGNRTPSPTLLYSLLHHSNFFSLNFCIIPSRVKQFSALSSEKRRENNICGRTFPARLA